MPPKIWKLTLCHIGYGRVVCLFIWFSTSCYYWLTTSCVSFSRKWTRSTFKFIKSVLAVAVSVCWLACWSDRQWSSWDLEKNNLWSDVEEQTHKYRDLPRCLARWGFTPRGLVVFEDEGRIKRWFILLSSPSPSFEENLKTQHSLPTSG